MLISLVGYMGSGKSHIATILREKLNLKLIDLDQEISARAKQTIPQIFEKKGELFFRKLERELLEELIATENNAILSLGGGTPAYYNNMEIINQNTKSFYLKTSVKCLSARLSLQKEKRPLIAKIPDDELPEFIAKHLFERIPFYSKAQFTINTDDKSLEMVADEIIHLLQEYF